MNYNEIPNSTIQQYDKLTSKLMKSRNYFEKEYDNELIMYSVLFPYLKLGKGKTISQVCHGMQQATEFMIKHDLNLYKKYIEDCVKITLKINNKNDLINLLDNTLNFKKFLVIDSGRTQCNEDTLTCITFLPIKRKDVPIEISNLNLY
tara:strand:- start:57 stop:500 length:444 start_codon:yes stop_codon:yes gene_type:complete